MGVLKVKDPVTGQWENIAGKGEKGDTGVSTVIISDFTDNPPSALPPSGLIPVDFCSPGTPAVATQLVIGQSLYYRPVDTLDPLFGSLWQHVGTTIVPEGFINVGEIVGPPGPTGADGPQGQQGEIGPDEVYVGPTQPTGQTDIWYDPSVPDPPPIGLETVAVLKANIFAHTFIGPWIETNDRAVWTVDLPPGIYMAVLNVASLSTGTGARGVNLWIDGVRSDLQSYLWFNAANVHHMMNTDIEFLTLGGTHELWVKDNGSVLGDSNDRGSLMLIPCDPA